ncbi:MAG: hypothetical protein AB2417_09900 [Clostridiaceae bacterium]
MKTILSEKNSALLTDYSIEYVGGEAEILKRLQFPKSNAIKYNFIGVYDDNQKDKINSDKLKINWSFCFLPTQKSVEEEFKEIVSKNITIFPQKVGHTQDKIIQILSLLDGKDEHDWLLDLSKELGKEIQVVFSVLYDLWRQDNNESLQETVDSLLAACYT